MVRWWHLFFNRIQVFIFYFSFFGKIGRVVTVSIRRRVWGGPLLLRPVMFCFQLPPTAITGTFSVTTTATLLTPIITALRQLIKETLERSWRFQIGRREYTMHRVVRIWTLRNFQVTWRGETWRRASLQGGTDIGFVIALRRELQFIKAIQEIHEVKVGIFRNRRCGQLIRLIHSHKAIVIRLNPATFEPFACQSISCWELN